MKLNENKTVITRLQIDLALHNNPDDDITGLSDDSSRIQHFDYLIDESFITDLPGISVEYNSDGHCTEITLEPLTDLKELRRIIMGYCELVEHPGHRNNMTDLDKPKLIPVEYVDIKSKIIDYDNATVGLRGADDGTFDYAGTYVHSILDILIICTNGTDKQKLLLEQLREAFIGIELDNYDESTWNGILGIISPEIKPEQIRSLLTLKLKELLNTEQMTGTIRENATELDKLIQIIIYNGYFISDLI